MWAAVLSWVLQEGADDAGFGVAGLILFSRLWGTGAVARGLGPGPAGIRASREWPEV